MNDKPKVILTEPKVLRQIKSLQVRRQLLPILAIALVIFVNIFLKRDWMMYPALAAFAWYVAERMMWRTRHKILVPEAGSFVSPVNGKVRSVTAEADGQVITLSKSFLDVVELRLPYPDLKMENNRTWLFETGSGKISLKIQSDRITFFENKNEPGAVIGVLPGNCLLTVILPETLRVLVKAGQPLFGGETVLFNAGEGMAEADSILVEEPLEDLKSE